MAMGTSRWKVITPSEFPWEQEAFDYLRAQLPDADPYVAWQGFNFIADNGSIYEVDLLVLTPVGFFLVEVKSRPGVLAGDAGTWTWKQDGRLFSVDNPLILANAKAKKLATLLRRQKACKDLRPPFLEPLVFCSAPGLQCELPPHARTRLCLRDRGATGDREARTGIGAALRAGVIDGVDPDGRTPRVDRATMGCVVRAMEQAGIRQSERYRLIADYRLKSLLMEGPGWQDWEGVHKSLPENLRRIRRYTLAAAASAEERETLLRAARREYQILDNLSHPGILSVKGFTDNEFGPAIIFEHHPRAVRLDHYLASAGSGLGVDVRVDLLRQVAEATQHAHGKGVYHRSLSPQCVLVTDPNAPLPRVKIFNWQTASRDLVGSTGSPAGKAVTATVHIEQLVEGGTTAYMAPEALLEHEGGGEHLDVFSLGALAYHLFSGRPPASGFLELNERIRESRGLQISAALDGATQALQELVQFSTHPEVTSRYGSAEEFLLQLEQVEDELTAPEPEQAVHPLDAKKGDRLEGGLVVRSRLGSGSTSVALLVEAPDKKVSVLKVARGPEHNARLREEADVLRKLRHQHIVEVYGTVEISGLTGILMDRAGDETLSKRIRDEGRLHPDLLQRFGDDLLTTVDWLEHQGIPHRDIKPDNIGVGPLGRGNRLHLILFDFSLCGTSLDNIRAGTVRYMDPVLSLRRPPRWDLAAERYSAAATLYEMATGDLPRWGDGRTDPAMLSCEATLDGDRFDPEVRENLLAFFTRAFRRNPGERFDNARDMLKAWRDAFESPGSTAGEQAVQVIDLDKAIAAATLDTPIASLGLLARAVTALDRVNVATVQQLLGYPLRRIHRMKGVGNNTRRHLADAVTKLRAKFPDVTPAAASPADSTDLVESQAPVWSVERLVQTITGGGTAATKARVEGSAVRAFLGLAEGGGGTPTGSWPTQSDVAREMSVSNARVSQWVDAARRRWQKNPSVTLVRGELLEALEGRGGVMAATELARALLATRGSNLSDEGERFRMASAVVRAAVEAERNLAQPKLASRRRDGLVLVSRVYDEEDPSALCDYAVRLGDEADRMAAAEPLPTPQRVTESLRRVRPPEKAPYVDDTRLVTLAAASSKGAAVSSRLELYPRGMEAGRALKLALGALAGARELSLQDIRDRVHGRYPDAATLPDRPELDRLLREAGWPFHWDETHGTYRPARDVSSLTTTATTTLPRYSTAAEPPRPGSPEFTEANDFEERLRRSLAKGTFMALSTAPRHVRRAAADLADRFGLEVKNLDEVFIDEIRRQAGQRQVEWSAVLAADAGGPAGPHWARLMTLVKAAASAVTTGLLGLPRPLLLIYPGLFARYGLIHVLDELRDGAGRSGKVPGLWLLIGSDQQGVLPTIDGQPMPVLGHGQWAWVPESWLRNDHRGNPTSGSGPKEALRT